MNNKNDKFDVLKNKTIHVVPYTHADVAWVHPRDWHIDRYVRVIDEVLDMLDADPEYRYYIDTWTELVKPYLQLRPKNKKRLIRYIKSGKIAICCGHYGNVRSTQVSDETLIRNLQYGLKHWKSFIPGLDTKVYANLDVGLGHTQMPQLLSLAGLAGYFAQRPLRLLDKQGIPRVFFWEGLSGDRILMFRQEYGGLYMGNEKKNGSWQGDWNYSREIIWEQYLKDAAKDDIDNIVFCVGSDDARPDRLNYGYDRKIEIPELIRLWNKQEYGTMKFSNPDEYLDSVLSEKDKLKTVKGVLDPGDVCYNTAWSGRRGIWWLRELADRLLVEAELLSSLAKLTKKLPYPETELITAWEKLLDYTPHAVQWLLRDDWAKAEFSIKESINIAQKIIEKAGKKLVNSCLPMDSAGIAFINTLPEYRKEIVEMTVLNGDLSRDLAGLVDRSGKPVPIQLVDYLVYHSEITLLAEVEVPSCGTNSYGLNWSPIPDDWKSLLEIKNYNMPNYLKEKHNISEKKDVISEKVELDNGSIKLTFDKGTITEIKDTKIGISRVTDKSNPFFDMVYFPVKSFDWSTGEGIPDNPVTFEVETAFLTEQGPLRHRIVRSGKCSGYRVRQYIDLIKGERLVRSTTQIFSPNDLQDSFIGISIPIDNNAQLSGDIPFGIEERNLVDYPYGEGERGINGKFWVRTWTAANNDTNWSALLAVDGDKFFRAYGTPKRLIHFMARQHRFFETGWESFVDAYDTGGRQVFQHCLVIGDGEVDRNELVRLADQVRKPVRYYYVPDENVKQEKEYLSVTPHSVRLSAMLYEKKNLIVRLTQMGDKSENVVLTLPVQPKKVTAVDFNGKPLPIKIKHSGKKVRFTIAPWKIVTLKIEN